MMKNIDKRIIDKGFHTGHEVEYVAIQKSDYECLKRLAERAQSLEYYKKDWMLVVEQSIRYREALEFYADEENYKPFDGIFLSNYQNKVDEDGGKKARQALKEGEE